MNRDETVYEQTERLFRERYSVECRRVNQFMIWLMVFQWFAGLTFALLYSPYTWIGEHYEVHVHVWAAAILGGAISSAAILSILRYPDAGHTRHIVAAAQVLWSALLIHLSGGRIETHFHVFASLAILSVYRDWKILITATVVVAIDHLVRGIWYPLSAFGVVTESPFRWIEHAFWVIFEIVFLVPGCMRLRNEIRELCRGQIELEWAKKTVDRQVAERTAELVAANARLASKTEEANLLSIVAQHTTSGVVIADPDLRIEWINDGFKRTTGYGLTEVHHQSPIELMLGPDSDPDTVVELKDGIRRQTHTKVTIKKYKKDRTTYWSQLEVCPVFDEGGQLQNYVGVENDITLLVDTNQRLAEKTLEAEKLALVARHTDNAVVITDAAGRIEWVNAGFERVTGFQLADVRGQQRFSLQHGEKTDQNRIAAMLSAMESGEGFDEELVLYGKTGIECWMAIEVRPFLDDSGALTQFISIEKDVSGRKKAEEIRDDLQQQLVDASRQAGMAEIATGVLHNVGNVLNSVNVSASMIADHLSSSRETRLLEAANMLIDQGADLPAFLTADPRGQHFPSYLHKTAETLVRRKDATLDEVRGLVRNIEHIKDIVSMQQAHASKGGIVQDVRLNEVVDDAIRISELSLDRHGICLRRDYRNRDDHIITTDKHKVLQILVNLISNAKHAVAGPGCEEKTVTIDTSLEGDLVEISVRDTGIGIRKEHLSELFRHGFTTREDGHGFGLHSGANAAKALRGTLGAYSEGPGCGARFTLSLPRKVAESGIEPGESPVLVGSEYEGQD